MLTNFTSMITTIRKETEKLRDNLINNVPSNPPSITNINLSSLFQNTITKLGNQKFGQNSSENDNHDARRALLLQKKHYDLTVDTRKIRPSAINIRENFIYEKFPNNFENINVKNNHKNTAKTTTTTAENKSSSSSSSPHLPPQNKNRNDRFTNFQIKTLNNLQDQNSDLSLAEELFMAEILREREEQRVNNVMFLFRFKFLKRIFFVNKILKVFFFF